MPKGVYIHSQIHPFIKYQAGDPVLGFLFAPSSQSILCRSVCSEGWASPSPLAKGSQLHETNWSLWERSRGSRSGRFSFTPPIRQPQGQPWGFWTPVTSPGLRPHCLRADLGNQQNMLAMAARS